MTFSISGRSTSSLLTLDFQESSFEDLSCSSEVEFSSEPSSTNSSPGPLDTARRLITRGESKRLRGLLFTTLISEENGYLLNFCLIRFFQRLRLFLNSSPSLCGSSVSHIVNFKEQYKDKDFIIPITLSLTGSKSCPAGTNMLAASLIRTEALRVRNIVEDLIIEIFKEAYPHIAAPRRVEIFNHFFSSQFLKVEPIAFDQEKKGNRFSLLKFGEMELKFSYNLSILWNEDSTLSFIPGLENPCAFDKDSLQIPLAPILDVGFVDLAHTEIISVTGSINEALISVKIGELKTSAPDGSKFIKLLDYITFRSSFCDRDLALKLLENFFEKFTIEEIEQRIHSYFSERIESNKLGVIVALLNMLILSKEKELPLLQQKIEQIIITLFNTRSKSFIDANPHLAPLTMDWILVFITLFSDRRVISEEKNQTFYSFAAQTNLYSLFHFDIASTVTTLLEQPFDLLPLYKNLLFQIRAEFSIKEEADLIKALIEKCLNFIENKSDEFSFYEFLHSYKKHLFRVPKEALFSILRHEILPGDFLMLLPEALFQVQDKNTLLTRFDRYAIEGLNIKALEQETSCRKAKLHLIKILLRNNAWHHVALSLFESLSKDDQRIIFEAFMEALTPENIKMFLKKHFSQVLSKESLDIQTAIYTHAIKKFETLAFDHDDTELFKPLFSNSLLSEIVVSQNKDFFILLAKEFLKHEIAYEMTWDFLISSKLIVDASFFEETLPLLKVTFRAITKEKEALNKKLLFMKSHLEVFQSVDIPSSFIDFINDELLRLIEQEDRVSLKSTYLFQYASWLNVTPKLFTTLFEVSTHLIETKNKDLIIKIDSFFSDSLKFKLCQKESFRPFFDLSIRYIQSLLKNNNTLTKDFFEGTRNEVKQDARCLLKAFKVISFFFIKEIEVELVDIYNLYSLFEMALDQLENLPTAYMNPKDMKEIADVLLFFISVGHFCQKAFLSLTHALTKEGRADLLLILENVVAHYSQTFSEDAESICKAYARLCLVEPTKQWNILKLNEMLDFLTLYSKGCRVCKEVLIEPHIHLLTLLHKGAESSQEIKTILVQRTKVLFLNHHLTELVLQYPVFKPTLELYNSPYAVSA